MVPYRKFVLFKQPQLLDNIGFPLGRGCFGNRRPHVPNAFKENQSAADGLILIQLLFTDFAVLQSRGCR